MHNVGYATWAFAAGIMVPAMMILNGQLGRVLKSSWIAVAVLLCVGFISAVVMLMVMRPALPALAIWRSVPPHLYFGGFIMAFYAISVTTLAPRFGVGNTVLFIVFAQMCGSAAIDAFGLFGAQIRPIVPARIIGMVLVLAGVITTQLSITIQQRN